jgi:chromosome segregation protein
MTARLTRLRIAGFKSFAEPVSLDILPGLTGIVGPNGCGKSNVVEALRWAMGETSARSLRGGEMDDVIFAGTTVRPSRNLAEVTITLERTADHALPAPFDADSELQLTRRIERGAGSAYRGNGRDMRARDVQTMFADLASGARSSAMVSQGRVSAIVNAKPEDRRQILEEAAGITGLHARRHEAELKLRAAEQNLSKAEDLRGQLETTRDGLRKQARQAARYRNISGLVRDAEAELLAVQHALANAALQAARAAHAEAKDAVAEAEVACAGSARAIEAAESGVPGPRAAEAAARSALERARLEAENMSQEAARAEAALASAAQRLADMKADAEDAARTEADSIAACARLAEEAAGLQASITTLPGKIAASQSHADAAEARVRETASAAEHAMREAAEAASASAQARIALDAATARAETARGDMARMEETHAAARAALVPGAALADASARVQAAEHALAAARTATVGAAKSEASAARTMAEAVAAHDLAKAEAVNAGRLVQEAAARFEKIGASHAALLAALAAVKAAQIPDSVLADAEALADNAAHALEGTEAAVQDGERVRMAASDAELSAVRHAQDVTEDVRRAMALRDAAAARHQRMAAEADSLAHALAESETTLVSGETVDRAAHDVRETDAKASASAEALYRASALQAEAERNLREARASAASAAAALARLTAEISGLRAALATHVHDHDHAHAHAHTGALDGVDVPAGLEAAFDAALDDVCDYARSPDAPRFWRVLPPMPAAALLPETSAFATLVQAPGHLQRALSHCLVLDEGADGDALHPRLIPGVTLVSRAGDVWRWDGRMARAGAPGAAATALHQRRLLGDAETRAVAAHAHADLAADAEAEAMQELDRCTTAHAACRTTQDAADAAKAAAREAHAVLIAAADQASARHAALQQALSRALLERDGTALALADAESACAALGSPEAAHNAAQEASAHAAAATAALEQARTDRLEARAKLAACVATLRDMQAAAADACNRRASLIDQVARETEAMEAAQTALAAAAARQAALPDLDMLEHAAREAQRKAADAQANAHTCQQAQDRAQLELDDARATAARLETARLLAETRLAAQADLLDRACSGHEVAISALLDAEAALRAVPDADLLAKDATAAGEVSATCRSALASALGDVAALEGALLRAQARVPHLQAEQESWAQRQAQAARRCEAARGRLAAADRAWRELSDAPALLTSRAEGSAAALAGAEAAHAEQAALLAEAEAALRGLGLAQRDTDARLAAARERLARGESAEIGAQAALHGVLTRAVERLGPEAVLADLPNLVEAAEERARRKWERLQREREEMGPVNLRADLELGEIDGRLEAIERDREELTTAIAKLRGAIGHLNREGRERLAAVFTDVDRHFRSLFTRMMGGGRAHLALTGSDDPLLAGLEIYAEPPGKKLSTLSLLSGGEQALTALSLIFAVFRCTPAPVAVLDEVDAPLDDANVERFCALMEDVVRETGTRFLVVTHHQVTMSRMDRLFGVTMQERGVSRLLSVDLRRAAEMVEAAPQAVAA